MPDGTLGPPAVSRPESLRERRRRELRRQLSDVATSMFLQRGFEAVRVADVAHACGVTEATVYNHFRTKESLLVDRWDDVLEGMSTALADPGTPPLEATLRVIDSELGFLGSPVDAEHPNAGTANLRRFRQLVGSTPSLVASERGALDRLTTATACALAERDGRRPGAPEPWIAAAALTGLWSVFQRSLDHHLLERESDASGIRTRVRRDVRRAADVLRRGL